MTDVEALYQQHARSVHRFALSLTGDRATADDLTSETFVRLWSARDRLDLTTVLGYLLTITRHLYLQGRRDHARRSECVEEPIDQNPGADVRLQSRSELDAVLADLQLLPEVDRAAVLMRATEQLSYEEIAAALDVTVGAAKVKVHRARRRLAALRLARSHAPSWKELS